MKNWKHHHLLILILSISFTGCVLNRPQYEYLSKDKIRQLKTIIVIIEPENELPTVLDVGGIRDKTYHSAFSGGPGMHGPLGVLIADLIAGTYSQYKINKALGGDKKEITENLNNTEAVQIIFNGISEAFREKTNACEYIQFDKIIFLDNQREDTVRKYKQAQADNILIIKYLYGIGVSEKHPPQPSIIALVEIFDPISGKTLDKTDLKTSLTSLYDSDEDVPNLEKYSQNNAAIFKRDLRTVAEIMGGDIARLYTYY